MKRILLWCFVAVAAAGENDRPAPPHAAVNPLLRELVATQVELYRQGVDIQDWKIGQLAGELEQAMLQQRRLEREESAALNELTNADGATGEGGARRVDIANIELPRLRTARQSHEQRVAELGTRLAKERERRVLLQQVVDRSNARLREIDIREQKEIGK